jgi:fumarate hydratase class II
MLVTALNPLISYAKAMCIRKLVQAEANTQMQAGEPLSWVLPAATRRRVGPAVVAHSRLALNGGGG